MLQTPCSSVNDVNPKLHRIMFWEIAFPFFPPHWVWENDWGWTSCVFWVDLTLGPSDTSDSSFDKGRIKTQPVSSESLLCRPQRMCAWTPLASDQGYLLWSHKTERLNIPFWIFTFSGTVTYFSVNPSKQVPNNAPISPPLCISPWRLQLQVRFLFAACQYEQLIAWPSCFEWPTRSHPQELAPR